MYPGPRADQAGEMDAVLGCASRWASRETSHVGGNMLLIFAFLVSRVPLQPTHLIVDGKQPTDRVPGLWPCGSI